MTATRMRRHPFRRVNGELEKWCPGCERWLSTRLYFSRRRSENAGHNAGEFLSRCKTCVCRPKVKHQGVSGYTPVLSCWWIFDEITMRVGQARGAEGIGISPEAMRNILYKRNRNVQRRNLYSAITYLRCLRADNVWDAPIVGKKLGYHERCSNCGTELNNYTDGCPTCWERRYRREQRRKEDERGMVLTRAQIVGLFNLTMNMPIDTQVDVQSIDDYGHAIVRLQSESTGITARHKLFAGGGVGELAA